MTGPQVSLVTWLAAVCPLAVILILMVLFRWGGTGAGVAGAIAAVVVAFFVFGAELEVLRVAALKSFILSFYVLYIIWAALLLYHVVDASGAIRSIGTCVVSLTEDHILQLLILGFAFSSFLQGIAGYGVPVAVVAPLLIGLGFPPIQAAAIPLVGHSWAITMGSLAASFQALIAVTGLPAMELGLWAATLLGISCIVTGFSVVHLHAGLAPVRRCLGAIFTLSLAMALTQLVLAYLRYWLLASFCAGMVGLALSLLIAKFSQRNRPTWFGLFPIWPSPWGRRTPHREISKDFQESAMGFHMAFSAYYVLILIVALTTLVPRLQRLLDSVRLSFHLPQTSTSLGWVTEASDHSLTLLGHPGAYLLYTTLAGWGIYRLAGYWASGLFKIVLQKTVWQGISTSIGVLSMTIMAMVMSYSGMTFLLARGLISVTGGFYPLLSPFVGLLGCFMTGSNTNSNLLFGALQRDSALLLQKDPIIMAALHTTGAALGGMVSPAKVLLACATTGLHGREGEVMRLTLKYCSSMVLIIGLLGWLLML